MGAGQSGHGRPEPLPVRFRSLLVPVDLTPASDRVLGRTALLSLADEAALTLMHVVPASLSPRHRAGAVRDARRILAREARRLSGSLPRSARIEPVVEVGSAPREIAECAAARGTELIVMGRGGGRALRDALLGSTAERVIRRSRLPVLAVRLAPRGIYRRPAVAVDLDEAAPRVLDWLLRVASAPPRRLEVIHAVDSPYAGHGYPSLSKAEIAERRAHLREQAAAKLRTLLAASLATEGDPPGRGPWRMQIRFGSAKSVIPRAIRAGGFELVALGTHGYAGIAHVFLGSVAGEVLRDVSCDVLIVPPPGASTPT
jgi:nucleotide-binding universal stress UspA family protein